MKGKQSKKKHTPVTPRGRRIFSFIWPRLCWYPLSWYPAAVADHFDREQSVFDRSPLPSPVLEAKQSVKSWMSFGSVMRSPHRGPK